MPARCYAAEKPVVAKATTATMAYHGIYSSMHVNAVQLIMSTLGVEITGQVQVECLPRCFRDM